MSGVSIPSSSGHVVGQSRLPTGRQPSSFNPLFIGACSRARPFGHCVYIVNEVVSIPSSSGHVVGRRSSGGLRRPFSDVSIPSSSGHVVGRRVGTTKGVNHDALVSIPSFIGACSRALEKKRRSGCRFSSFNPLFIGACSRATMCHQVGDMCYFCFNPLFIGACSRAGATLGLPRIDGEVSIPSSSGHVVGRLRVLARRRDCGRRFNPLFIGACSRACPRRPPAPVRVGRFNPLFIGACSRALSKLFTSVNKKFQSPLHRGM